MLSKINPVRNALTLRDAMNRLFDENFSISPDSETGSDRMARLPIDVYGTENEFIITASLPGVALDDVRITVENKTLTISGENPGYVGDVDYIYSERFHGRFIRTLQLNAPIDVDKIEASMKDGILTLTLPKMEAIKPRQISIKKVK